MEEKEDFSLLVHNFLNSIRAKEVPEEKIIQLIDFVNRLEQGTEKQKRRFIMFFDVRENTELETFSTIAEKEKCTYPAIKCCVSRIRSILVNLKDDKEKQDLLNIIKSDKI